MNLDTHRLIDVSLLYFLNKLDAFDLHHKLAEREPSGMLSPWIITWQGVIGHAYFIIQRIMDIYPYYMYLAYMWRFGQYQHHSAFSVDGEGYSLKI